MKRVLLLLGLAALTVSCDRVGSDSGEPEVAATRHLDADGYREFIATPGKVVAVMFHADWCGPCRIQGPNVEAVVAEFGGKAEFGMVDVDESAELARSLGVVGIPDLRIFRDGVMVDAMKGAIPKEQIRNHFAIQVAQLGEGGGPTSSEHEEAIAPMEKGWLPPGLEKR